MKTTGIEEHKLEKLQKVTFNFGEGGDGPPPPPGSPPPDVDVYPPPEDGKKEGKEGEGEGEESPLKVGDVVLYKGDFVTIRQVPTEDGGDYVFEKSTPEEAAPAMARQKEIEQQKEKGK